MATLEGKFFHRLENGRIEHQGRVVSDFGEWGLVEVKFFGWLAGDETYGTKLIEHPSNSPQDWIFYENDQELREAYAYGPYAPSLKETR